MKKLFLVGILVILSLTLLIGQSLRWMPDIVLTYRGGSWLDTRVYSSISAAIAAIGVDTVTLHIVRQETIGADLTIPTNVNLRFYGASSLTQTAGTTTIQGNIFAPDRSVLLRTGAGDYSFSSGTELRSAWFEDFDEAVDIVRGNNITLVICGLEFAAVTQDLGYKVRLKFPDPGDMIYFNAGVVLGEVNQIESGRYICLAGPGRPDFMDSVELRSSWFEDIPEAVRYVDDSLVKLTIDRSEEIVVNTTIPSNVSVEHEIAAVLTATADLEFAGQYSAEPYQTFDEASVGDITFTGPVEAVYPQWWGAEADGVADDTAAIQAAVDSISSGGTVFFPQGQYLAGQIDFYSGIAFIGAAVSRSTIVSSTLDAFLFRSHDGINQPPQAGLDYVTFENLTLDVDEKARAGIWAENVRHLLTKRCIIKNVRGGTFSYTDSAGGANTYDHCGIMVKGSSAPQTGAHYAIFESTEVWGVSETSPAESGFVLTSTTSVTGGRANMPTIRSGSRAVYCKIGINLLNSNDALIEQAYVSGVPDGEIGIYSNSLRTRIIKPYVEMGALAAGITAIHLDTGADDAEIYGRGSLVVGTGDTLVSSSVRPKWIDRSYMGHCRFNVSGSGFTALAAGVLDVGERLALATVTLAAADTLTEIDAGSGPYNGQLLLLYFGNANTTVQDRRDGGGGIVANNRIELRNGLDWVAGNRNALLLLFRTNYWHEMFRVDNYDFQPWQGGVIGNDATPSVKGVHILSLSATAPLNVTTFDDGHLNQHLIVYASSANITLVHGATLHLSGGVNLNMTAGDAVAFVNIAGVWRQVQG